VHRAAFALGIAAAAARQLRHDAIWRHARRQHVAVIAIRGDDLVALLQRGLHADDDGFLADIEVAEAADEPHAVELARALLEAADQQHVSVVLQQLVFARFSGMRAVRAIGRGVRHWYPPPLGNGAAARAVHRSRRGSLMRYSGGSPARLALLQCSRRLFDCEHQFVRARRGESDARALIEIIEVQRFGP
jgi:hypothetical protein